MNKEAEIYIEKPVKISKFNKSSKSNELDEQNVSGGLIENFKNMSRNTIIASGLIVLIIGIILLIALIWIIYTFSNKNMKDVLPDDKKQQNKQQNKQKKNKHKHDKNNDEVDKDSQLNENEFHDELDEIEKLNNKLINDIQDNKTEKRNEMKRELDQINMDGDIDDNVEFSNDYSYDEPNISDYDSS